METEQIGELVSVTFTWTIEKFSKLKSRKHYSQCFAVGDFKWQIVVYPKGSSGNSGKHDLSIYLNVADAETLPSGWSRYAQFTLTVVNQMDANKSITVETKHVFSASKSDWGFTSFMPLSELCDCTEGFLVNDVCVLEAEVAVSQVDYKISEVQETWFCAPIEPAEYEDQSKGPSDVEVPQSSTPRLASHEAPSFEHMQKNGDLMQVPNSLAAALTAGSDQVLDFLNKTCAEPNDGPFDTSIVKEQSKGPSDVEVRQSSTPRLASHEAPSFEHMQKNGDLMQVPNSLAAALTAGSDQVLDFLNKTCAEPNDGPFDTSIVKEHEEEPCTPVGELIHFRGLGRIEKAFVPLLEEVCLLHPSLIECQRKRSHMFIEWAFTALGRLLHFLKTTKGTDMTEDACEHLQLLWEELGTFNFNLAWLEPHVQSALGMKKFVERSRQVKEQRKNVEALEIEIKRLKARLTVAVVDFEVAKRDMGAADESFLQINMDSVLGYGSGILCLI